MARLKFKRIIGISGILIFVIFIIIVSFLFVKNFGYIIENPYRLREFVLGHGIWAYVIFSFINIFQIIFAPIPGHFITVASGIIFGFSKGILITWINVVIGGTMVMLLSRYFGKRMLKYLLDENAARFEKEITRRGIAFILLLSIFPNPIGDTLFYLAGITNLPMKILIPIIAFGRLPGIILSVLIGDRILKAGTKGWIIGGFGLFMTIILYFLFGEKIEKIFERIIDQKQLNQKKDDMIL